MAKPLSEQLADLSVQAKKAEDDFAATKKESHDKMVARREQLRTAATQSVDKLKQEMKSAGAEVSSSFSALKAKVAADAETLKANVKQWKKGTRRRARREPRGGNGVGSERGDRLRHLRGRTGEAGCGRRRHRPTGGDRGEEGLRTLSGALPKRKALVTAGEARFPLRRSTPAVIRGLIAQWVGQPAFTRASGLSPVLLGPTRPSETSFLRSAKARIRWLRGFCTVAREAETAPPRAAPNGLKILRYTLEWAKGFRPSTPTLARVRGAHSGAIKKPAVSRRVSYSCDLFSATITSACR